MRLDEHGYLTAAVPATTGKAGVPTIGFIATWTSPEMPGAGVAPLVHRHATDAISCAGRSVAGPAPEGQPDLGEQIGQDIVTASGATLLGADNKAASRKS